MPETQSRKQKTERPGSPRTSASTQTRAPKPASASPQPRRSPIRPVVRKEIPSLTPLSNLEDKKRDEEIDEVVQKHIAYEKEAPTTILRAPKRSLLSALLGVVAVVVVIVLAGLVVLGVGIYRFHWGDTVTLSIANVVPYPIAVVDAELIRYNDYTADVKTLKHYYQKQVEQNPNLVEQVSDDEIQDSVKTRMIEEAIIRNIAKDLKVTVADDDIASAWSEVTGNGQVSDEEITKTLSDIYNWTPEQFKEHIIRPFVLRQKVSEALNRDETYQADVRAKAENVLAEVKKGETSFEDLAKKNSDDSSAQKGGDLGSFTEGEMVPEFESAVKALAVGQMSELVQTQYGYHIIKLEGKDPVEKKAGEAKDSATDEQKYVYHAKHILIAYRGIDDRLAEKQKSLRIWKFL